MKNIRTVRLDALTSVVIEPAPKDRIRLSMVLGGITMSAKEISYDHAQQISEGLCEVVSAALGVPAAFPAISHS